MTLQLIDNEGELETRDVVGMATTIARQNVIRYDERTIFTPYTEPYLDENERPQLRWKWKRIPTGQYHPVLGGGGPIISAIEKV